MDTREHILRRRMRRTASHIESMIRTLLQTHPDCEGVVIGGQVFKLEPDRPSAPTWGYQVDLSSHGGDAQRCATLLDDLIAELQRRYDVAG